MGKNCQDYIEGLNDYIDGELDAELCSEIEKHLGKCRNCRIMVDSLKQTVTLCREGKCEELPESLQNKLTSAMKERWKKKFPDKA